MAILRPVSEMKDSGIEWMGLIPVKWMLHRIRNNYRIITGNGFKPELQGHDSGRYPVCKASDISSAGNTLSSAANYIDEATAREEHFNIIPANSIIFPKIGEAMKKNNRTRVLVDCCVDNNCQGLVPQLINPVYSYYLLSCIDMRWFDNAGTIPSLNNQKLKDCKIPYPTLTEQQAIASYLDDRCSKIDEIIAEAEKSIEEYKELKQAVITEAVTKGISPTSYKYSGYKWIGDIPEGWNISPLKHVSRKSISYGVIKLFEPDDNGVSILRCSDVKAGFIDTSNIRTITKDLSNEYKRTVLSKDDVVINVRGTLGGCAVVPNSMEGFNIAREVALISPIRSKYDSRYIMYYLLSNVFEKFRDMSLSGAIYVGINMETLSNFRMAYPSIEEQKAIAEYIEKRVFYIDSLISEKQSLIEDLKVYKKSLIYEIVTGKRRVV